MGVDGRKYAKRLGETTPMAGEDGSRCLMLTKALVSGIEAKGLYRTYLQTLSEPHARLEWRDSSRV